MSLFKPFNWPGGSVACAEACAARTLPIDAIPEWTGLPISDVARAMESIGRLEDCVTTAEYLKLGYPDNPYFTVELNCALGRCYAKMGRADEAVSAFEAAFAECTRAGHPYHEVLARCEYIEHVLDPEGRRAEGLVLLGKTIKSLVLDPSAYNDVLGAWDIDAEAAVVAYNKALANEP